MKINHYLKISYFIFMKNYINIKSLEYNISFVSLIKNIDNHNAQKQKHIQFMPRLQIKIYLRVEGYFDIHYRFSDLSYARLFLLFLFILIFVVQSTLYYVNFQTQLTKEFQNFKHSYIIKIGTFLIFYILFAF